MPSETPFADAFIFVYVWAAVQLSHRHGQKCSNDSRRTYA